MTARGRPTLLLWMAGETVGVVEVVMVVVVVIVEVVVTTATAAAVVVTTATAAVVVVAAAAAATLAAKVEGTNSSGCCDRCYSSNNGRGIRSNRYFNQLLYWH